MGIATLDRFQDLSDTCHGWPIPTPHRSPEPRSSEESVAYSLWEIKGTQIGTQLFVSSIQISCSCLRLLAFAEGLAGAVALEALLDDGFGFVRGELQGGFGGGDGGGVVAGGGLGSGEGVQAVGVALGGELAGGLGEFDGARGIAELVVRGGGEQPGEVVVGLPVLRFEGDRLRVVGDGVGQLAELLAGVAAVGVGGGVVRVEFDRLGVVGDGFVVVVEEAVGDAAVIECFGELRADSERLVGVLQ